MTSLDRKVEEYHKLKTVREGLDERIKELSDQIKKQLSEGEHSFGKYSAEIQVRDRTSLDEFAAEEVRMSMGRDQSFRYQRTAYRSRVVKSLVAPAHC